MDYFRRLGEAIEDEWLLEGRQEERFPEAAETALTRHEAAFDRDAFIDHVLDRRRSATQQLAPVGAFGQPGITMFHGNGFVIEVYYWLSSVPAIHNHPFCGVFTVLEGFSVHARYEPRSLEPAGGRALVGDIALAGVEVLAAGDRQLFSLKRHPLVHALIHVPVPSISMVLRTVRTEGYLRYLPPCIALPMEEPPEPMARQLALLSSMRRADDPALGRALARMLREADFEQAVRILSAVWTGSHEPEMQHLLAEARLGSRADAIARSLDRAIRVNEANALRERLTDPELRLAATALMVADTRAQVLAVLDGDLAPVQRLIESPAVFAPDETASLLIASALAAGEGQEGALRRLREEYGDQALAVELANVRAYCERSIFAPLGS